MSLYLTNIGILSGSNELIRDGHIEVVGSHIDHIGTGEVNDREEKIDGKGYLAVPGFIDLHIQGASGACVMDGAPDGMEIICKAMARYGTTGLLATPIPDPTDDYRNLRAVRHTIKSGNNGSKILGFHLEGPFLNPDFTGAFTGKEFETPSPELLSTYLDRCGPENVRMMTIAPELPGALEVIEELSRRTIVAALGHTRATYEETQMAFDHGAGHITHLFNAMPPFHHREPGVVGAALLDSRPSIQIIADGYHLHPETINLLIKLKNPAALCLVTDAMRCACLPDSGTYESFGKTITVKKGKVTLADGTIAGSTLTMDKAIKNMKLFTQLPLPEIIKMASLYPAMAIGLDEDKGSLQPNKDADIVLLDDELDVRLTMVEGKIVFSDL